MLSNVRVTDVVPAPDEPVMAMIGWRSDMRSIPEQAALGEQRRAGVARRRLVVVALDAFDLAARAEHEADALVQRRRLDAQHRLAPGAGAATGLLDHEADRVGFVQQAQPPWPRRVLAVARVEEHAAARQDAMRLGHHAGDPAHVEVLAARAGLAGQAFVDVARHRRLPEAAIAGVDREL